MAISEDVDLSEFGGPSQPRSGECQVGWALREMTAEQHDKLAAALSKNFSGAVIADVVTTWGYPVSAFSINRHRRGACRCPKS